MRIPPYWARARHAGLDQRGRPQMFAVLGWSFTSREEAQANAAARAKRVADLSRQTAHQGTYEYGQGPIKEEIIEEVTNGDSIIALITRNRYGALVLNTARVLFADVDFPAPQADGLLDAILSLFSAARRAARYRAVAESTIQQIEGWAKANPQRSFRLYRTREGLRLLFTDRLYDPTAQETTELLQQLNADPMYIKLTQKQECFRARLSAKPWRCGCTRPPNSIPRDTPEAEESFRRWEEEYIGKDAGYRICAFQAHYGRTADIPELHTIIQAHDRRARIESDAPLA